MRKAKNEQPQIEAINSKKTEEPIITQGMGKRCPSCGWIAEMISTYKDGTVSVACANCFLDKTPTKHKKRRDTP
jgi:hypothetical protein